MSVASREGPGCRAAARIKEGVGEVIRGPETVTCDSRRPSLGNSTFCYESDLIVAVLLRFLPVASTRVPTLRTASALGVWEVSWR